MAAYIYRSPAGAGSSTVFTMSYWVKRAKLGTLQTLFSAGTANKGQLVFDAEDQLKVVDDGAVVAETSRVFRDVGAWYHIVLAYDTGASSTDKCKIYVNGTLETSYATDNRSTAGSLNYVNSTEPQYIGADTGNTFDGEMSWVQMVDGAQLDPTEFGEVDATSGIWKIKTTPYATPGTNGFCLKMEDRTNLDLDSSSNAFTWTTSGNVTPTYDSPSNNFVTLNSLMNVAGNGTLSQGNNTWARTGNWSSIPANLGMVGGKWYWEVKATLITDSKPSMAIGIAEGPTTATQTQADWDTTNKHIGDSTLPDCYAWVGFGSGTTFKYNNGSSSVWGSGNTAGPDIIQVAFDATNGTIWIGRDGTWMNSATQGEIEAGTTTNAMYSGITVNNATPYIPAGSCEATTLDFNFGNGYFGITTVSSANTDTAGIGAMEYEVPDGYYCLCTKNIKAYGG